MGRRSRTVNRGRRVGKTVPRSKDGKCKDSEGGMMQHVRSAERQPLWLENEGPRGEWYSHC